MTSQQRFKDDFLSFFKGTGATERFVTAYQFQTEYGIEPRHVKELLLKWAVEERLISIEAYDGARFRNWQQWEPPEAVFSSSAARNEVRVKLLAAGAEYAELISRQRDDREMKTQVSGKMTTDSDPAPNSPDWDLFICHASEDKESLVKPLAEKLYAENLRVWYDEFTLKVGDNLRGEIDRGLSHSRFGVVVLSPDFFKKNWPQYELDGLVTREMGGQNVILPVWHGVTLRDVERYSPTLAGRVAAKSDNGIDVVVKMLIDAMGSRSSTEQRGHAKRKDWQPATAKKDDGPEVVIEYECNAKDERATRRAPLRVRNIRGGTAYRVQISDIRNGGLTAKFELISYIPEGQSVEVDPKVEDSNRTNPIFLDFVRVLEADYRNTSTEELFTPFRLPVHIAYLDVNGRRFETECEIEFHYFHKTAHAVFMRRT